METFRFVIDTEQYSGNFEREMTAFITGMIGECGVGQEYADAFVQDCRKDGGDINAILLNLVESRPTGDSDNLVMRPCEIYSTPGWYNDGNGKHLKDDGTEQTNRFPAYLSVAIFCYREPTEQEVELLKKRAYAFEEARQKIDKFAKYTDPIKITGFRLIKEETSVVEEPA